jgi:hypothetical protein
VTRALWDVERGDVFKELRSLAREARGKLVKKD